jgi:hypothetical protein
MYAWEVVSSNSVYSGPKARFGRSARFLQEYGVGSAYGVVGLDERVVDGDDIDIVVLDAARRG